MQNMLQNRKSERGFTLVELAIVLVIIGLIIGGVLVGQDLIKAAQIRATVSQIEKYNAAVNTFRTRFNGLPGDLRNPADFSLDNTFVGNGDRRLTGGNTTTDDNGTPGDTSDDTIEANMDEELTMFWRHLSQANLVDGAYDGAQAAEYAVGTTVPRAKIDRSGIGVYSAGGYNYYQIGAKDNSATILAVYGASLTPNEAYNIDVKVDDGMPGTGQTIARGGVAPNAALSGTEDDGSTASCATTDVVATANYTLSHSAVTCQLRLRMN